MMIHAIFSVYIFLETYKQYIHVIIGLLCENGPTNIRHTPQNKKYFNRTLGQPILMAAMLVKY